MTRKKPKKSAALPSPAETPLQVTVEGQPMLVDYTPNGMRDTGQFEFRSPHKPARRIPDTVPSRPSSPARCAQLKDGAGAPRLIPRTGCRGSPPAGRQRTFAAEARA